MKEIWKDIKGYEGFYQISNLGRVKSLKKWSVNDRAFVSNESLLTPWNNGNDYLVVSLSYNNKRKNHYIHRLVAEHFIDNPYEYSQVNHKDYNKRNNNVNNLEWCTAKYNRIYSQCNFPKRIKHPTNTGEYYISKRKGVYRITIDKKEYTGCSTLEDAIKKRDEILREKGVDLNW